MNGGQIGNVDLVKQLNSAAVYRLIDQQGPISRIQVADVSQLAPASVTKITRQLLERGSLKRSLSKLQLVAVAPSPLQPLWNLSTQ